METQSKIVDFRPTVRVKAIFVSPTLVAGVQKYRWICGSCNHRVNLHPSRLEHQCPNCRKIMVLKKPMGRGFN